MKKSILFAGIFLLMTSLIFSACSKKDDDPSPKENANGGVGVIKADISSADGGTIHFKSGITSSSGGIPITPGGDNSWIGVKRHDTVAATFFGEYTHSNKEYSLTIVILINGKGKYDLVNDNNQDNELGAYIKYSVKQEGESPDISSEYLVPVSGQLDVSAYKKGTFKATFSATLKNLKDNEVTITNGKINTPFKLIDAND